MYAVAQRTLYPEGGAWLKRYTSVPGLMLLGCGIALSNARAVLEAVLGVRNVFQRTPKFRIEEQDDCWRGSAYALPLDVMVVGELLVTLYALATIVVAVWQRNLYAVPFFLLYVAGFGYVGLQGLWDARQELALWVRRVLRISKSASQQIPRDAEPILKDAGPILKDAGPISKSAPSPQPPRG
jgi:hypothetical protein